MVVTRLPDGRWLLDRAALAAHLARGEKTIRRHCTPVASWVPTRGQLYDTAAAQVILDALPRPRSLTKA